MKLALEEIKYNKGKYFMITFIIMLISWLVFLLTGLGNGLNTLNAATIKNINGNYLVFEKDSENKFTKSTISGTQIEKIKKLKNVDDATLLGSSMSSVSNEKGNKKTDITIVGITNNSFIAPKVVEGTINQTNDKRVIVDKSLEKNGYKVGDHIKISGLKKVLIIGGFTENNTFNHLPTVWLPLNLWQEIRYAAPGSDDGNSDPVNAFVLQTNSDFKVSKLTGGLSNLKVVTREDAVQAMPGYAEENGTIVLMLVFLIAISAIIIGVFFYILTMQKINQFGILKAMGAKNKYISRIVVSQVALITIVGVVLGVGFTYAVAAILPKGMPFDLNNTTVILYGIGIILISLFTTIFSVKQVVKVDPLIALGRVE